MHMVLLDDAPRTEERRGVFLDWCTTRGMTVASPLMVEMVEKGERPVSHLFEGSAFVNALCRASVGGDDEAAHIARSALCELHHAHLADWAVSLHGQHTESVSRRTASDIVLAVVDVVMAAVPECSTWWWARRASIGTIDDRAWNTLMEGYGLYLNANGCYNTADVDADHEAGPVIALLVAAWRAHWLSLGSRAVAVEAVIFRGVQLAGHEAVIEAVIGAAHWRTL